MIPCPFNSLLKSLVFGGKERQQNRSLLFFLFLSFSSAMIPQDDMSYKFPSSFYLLIPFLLLLKFIWQSLSMCMMFRVFSRKLCCHLCLLFSQRRLSRHHHHHHHVTTYTDDEEEEDVDFCKTSP